MKKYTYSRGYKNRAIVKKMFEFFADFLRWYRMPSFQVNDVYYSRKDLACMLGSFLASQSTWATVGGRDGPPPPFSSNCNFLQDA
jgi:hypothetical protein